MARTAPVPDIPPIPGMNPGTVIAGGGGGGPGDGDGDGDKGNGDDNADGDDGGNDAEDDGRDADGCGAGTGGSGCPVHGTKPTAGDPIDVLSGRVFTWPATDLVLPGPQVLVFQRRYSSAICDRDVGLGWGWSHTFAWQLTRSGRELQLLTERGMLVDFEAPRPGEVVWSREGFTVWLEGDRFVVDARDGEARVFACAAGDDPDHALFRLVAVRDQNNNAIALHYSDQGQLVAIQDSAGRTIRIRAEARGRIGALEVRNAETNGRWIAFATYRYDDRGHLDSVTDADGFVWRFTYDDDHRLTSHCSPEGLRFHFRYDKQGRGTETWGAYDGRDDPSLAADAPQLLADGQTRCRGVHHVKIVYGPSGFREVADSVQVQRYFTGQFGRVQKTVCAGGVTTREFDQFGYVTSVTDPLGATTAYDRDEQGRVLRETDPLGRTQSFVRDSRGLITKVQMPDGGTWEVGYDARGNRTWERDPTGGVTQYEYDRRGMLTGLRQPDGAVTRYAYDAQGNLVSRTDPNGAVWKYGYDGLGSITSIRNPLGAQVNAAYTDGGRPISIVDADGGVSRFTYDGSRRLVKVSSPTGNVSKWEWGGLDRIVARQLPTGDIVRYRYNREGWLTEVHNEQGEVHFTKHDPAGWVIEEKTFAGRVLRYTRNAIGNVTRLENGAGEVTEFEYNGAGELIKKTYADDSVEEFFYDPCGRALGMRSAVGEWRLDRNLAGYIVRERQTMGGVSEVVDLGRDGLGRVVQRSSSLGLDERIQRGPTGARVGLSLDQTPVVRHELDALGLEIARAFSGGGRLDLQFDQVGCLRQLRFGKPSALAARPAGEPEWLGPAATGAAIEKRYTYNPAGELLSAWDAVHGVAEQWAYDGRKRVVTRQVRGAVTESFRYDPTGNVYEAGGNRQYARGDVLLAKDRTRYIWDGDGRLIEKRVATPLHGEQTTRLAWDGAGRLARVELPDGSSICADYDPIGRRVRRRVFGPPSGGPAPLRKTVRSVWNGDRLVHEITELAAEQGDPVVAERTYVFGEDDFVPHAHRDSSRRADGAPEHGEWLFYVTDHNGTTDALVRGDGTVAAEMQRSTWGVMRPAPGATANTPLRLPGQYEDAETGLHYNRFRYYDPDAGRFISPDPIGLEGGDNLYAYLPNPIGWIDPLGLHTATATLEGKPVANPNNPDNPRQFNSGYNGENNNNDPWVKNMVATTGKPGRGYRESHSEFGLMRQLAGENGTPKNKPPHLRVNPDLEGQTLEIKGQSRSCPSCAKALETFARNNKMKVVYSGGGGKPAKLQMDFRPPDKGGTGESNRKQYSSATAAQYRADKQKNK